MEKAARNDDCDDEHQENRNKSDGGSAPVGDGGSAPVGVGVGVSKIFPAGKIRNELRKDDEIGKITKSAVDLVSACSVVFVRRLALAARRRAIEDGDGDGDSDGDDAATATTAATTTTATTTTISLNHVRASIVEDPERYDFLEDNDALMRSLKEPRPTKRRRADVSSSEKQRPRQRTSASPRVDVAVAKLCAGGVGGARRNGVGTDAALGGPTRNAVTDALRTARSDERAAADVLIGDTEDYD